MMAICINVSFSFQKANKLFPIDLSVLKSGWFSYVQIFEVCRQGLETQAYVASSMNSLVFAEQTVLLNWFATVTLLLHAFFFQE
jgi:hypothetical protein